MAASTLISLSIGALAAIYYLLLLGQPETLWRSVVKTLPMLMLALTVVTLSGSGILALALLCSAIGDWALSRPSQKAFLIGMAAFAVAHLAYIAAMLPLVGGAFQVLQWPIALLIGVALSTELWLSPKTGTLRWPVRAYVIVIAGMALVALNLPEGHGMVRFGAMLFLLSDVLLSIDLFCLQPKDKWHRLTAPAVWIFYIAAQLALMIGLSPNVF